MTANKTQRERDIDEAHARIARGELSDARHVVFAAGAEHGRRDLEAVRQQARSEAMREAAGLARRQAGGEPKRPGDRADTLHALALMIESLATSPAQPAAPPPADDGVARRLLDDLLYRMRVCGGFACYFRDLSHAGHFDPAVRAAIDRARAYLAGSQPAADALTYAEGKRDAARAINDEIARQSREHGERWAVDANAHLGPLLSELASLDEPAPADDARTAAVERADVVAWLRELAGPETSLNHDAAMVFHDCFSSGAHEGAASRAKGGDSG